MTSTMTKLIKNTTFYTKSLFFAWLFLFAISLNLPQRLEGAVLPVVKDFSINSVNMYENGIRFYGSFIKLRNCSFENIEAHMVDENGQSKLYIRFDDRPVTRKSGEQLYGPWFLQANSTDSVQITAYHVCHPFWLTETRLR